MANEFFQNPLVMMGARLMQASDPRMTGLGGLGAAITGTGQELQQRAQLAEENERARMLADLQMQALQAQLRGTKRAEQREADLSALYASPEFAGLPIAEQVSRVGAIDPDIATSILTSRMTKSPAAAQTDIGRANADLQAGRITQQQYQERVQAIQNARKSAQFAIDATTGITNVFDKNNMTLTQVTSDGQQRTIQLTPEQAAAYTGEPVAPAPSVAPAATAESTAPGQPDPFAVQDRARAIKGLPNEVQKEFIAAESSVNRLPAVIERVRSNPAAFGPEMGATRYLGEGAQGSALSEVYADVARSRLTPEQDRARIEVFKEASAIINELAGAAVSGSEQKRIESFAPKETDTAEQIITKLNSALEESTGKLGRISESYGVPGIKGRKQQPWKQKGTLKYRQVR